MGVLMAMLSLLLLLPLSTGPLVVRSLRRAMRGHASGTTAANRWCLRSSAGMHAARACTCMQKL